MEFVKDHRADPRQLGVGLDHPRQDAFGHDLDPGLARHFGLAAHAVADGLACRFAQSFGHPLGCGPRRQTPGFQHDDALRCQPRVQHCQRHPRGLARPGGRLQHGAAPITQMRDKL